MNTLTNNSWDVRVQIEKIEANDSLHSYLIAP